MPGTTPKGYPYAQPADPLVQWPATSQALAEKLEAAPFTSLVGMAVGSPTLTFTTGADGKCAIICISGASAAAEAQAHIDLTLDGLPKVSSYAHLAPGNLVESIPIAWVEPNLPAGSHTVTLTAADGTLFAASTVIIAIGIP